MSTATAERAAPDVRLYRVVINLRGKIVSMSNDLRSLHYYCRRQCTRPQTMLWRQRGSKYVVTINFNDGATCTIPFDDRAEMMRWHVFNGFKAGWPSMQEMK